MSIFVLIFVVLYSKLVKLALDKNNIALQKITFCYKPKPTYKPCKPTLNS